MRLHRLLGILILMDSGGIIKAGKLANILETSERTIYRDIEILCQSGIPIMSIPGPKGGYAFMENYKIKSNIMLKGDMVNLLLSTIGVRPEKNSDSELELQNLMLKLENGLSQENKEEIINARKKFFVDTEPWFGEIVNNNYMDLIKKSVLEMKKLKIKYKNYDGIIKERIIRPLGVIVKNNLWYVAAFCERTKEQRVFKCSRIEAVEYLDEGFSTDKGFNLEDFWERSKENIALKSKTKVGNSYLVTVKLKDESIKFLSGFNIFSSVKSGDSYIKVFDMISFETALSVIFSLSDKMEVIEPSDLKNSIIEKAKNILDIYKSLT